VLGAYAESALFVEPGDSGGFAEALNRLRNNPALRASMSANSLRTADLYTIKRHTDRLLEVFGQE
jgi:glycosyltransferase involved in cell wall biosynthesis